MKCPPKIEIPSRMDRLRFYRKMRKEGHRVHWHTSLGYYYCWRDCKGRWTRVGSPCDYDGHPIEVHA